jgi:hypothetical protein
LLYYAKKRRWRSVDSLKRYLDQMIENIALLPTTELLGGIARVLSAAFEPMAEKLANSTRIKDFAEYKFVNEVAEAWYRATKRVPTLTRNDYVPKTQRRKSGPPESSRLFEPFIKKVVPKPQIGDEIIRSVLDAMRERFGGGKS